MLHILYTLEEGGDYFQIAKNSDEETRLLFDETVSTGQLIYGIGTRYTKIRPAYIALVETKEDYDFVLQDSRLNPTKDFDATPAAVVAENTQESKLTPDLVDIAPQDVNKLEEGVIPNTNDTPKP